MKRKLPLAVLIVPIMLATVGTGFGVWVFNNKVSTKEQEVSMKLEPSVVVTGFKA